MELESAAEVAQTVVEQFLNKKQSSDPVLLNVNIPNMPYSVLSGISVTRLGRRHSADHAVPELDPRGEQVYWLDGPASPVTRDRELISTQRSTALSPCRRCRLI